MKYIFIAISFLLLQGCAEEEVKEVQMKYLPVWGAHIDEENDVYVDFVAELDADTKEIVLLGFTYLGRDIYKDKNITTNDRSQLYARIKETNSGFVIVRNNIQYEVEDSSRVFLFDSGGNLRWLDVEDEVLNSSLPVEHNVINPYDFIIEHIYPIIGIIVKK